MKIITTTLIIYSLFCCPNFRAILKCKSDGFQIYCVIEKNKVVNVCSEDGAKIFRNSEGEAKIRSQNHTKRRKRKHIQGNIWGNRRREVVESFSMLLINHRRSNRRNTLHLYSKDSFLQRQIHRIAFTKWRPHSKALQGN